MGVLPKRDAGIQARILAEFGIDLGQCLGIEEGGFRADSTDGENGIAYITLVVRTTRSQVARILTDPDPVSPTTEGERA